MTERLNGSVFNVDDFKQVVLSSGQTEFYEGNKLNHQVQAIVILCPLYAPGNINDSSLAKDVADVHTDTRIGGKIEAYLRTLRNIEGYLKTTGSNLNVTFVLANRGVLLPVSKHTPENEAALDHHKMVYQNIFGEFGDVFLDYNDLKVDFPRFVDPTCNIPTLNSVENESNKSESHNLIELLNNTLDLPQDIPNNKKSRHLLKSIINTFGINSAYWIVGGYLVFDHMIPSLVGTNGLYLSAERFDPLLKIDRLTPSLDTINKIKIKA